MSSRFLFLFLLLAIFQASCGATRTLKPLGDGKSQASLSVGGPLITQGFVIPAPYAVLGYDYGLTDRVNVFGAIHPTALAYKFFAMEAGASYELLRQDGGRPEIMIEGRGFIGANDKDAVFFPSLTPIFSYQVGAWTPYVGADALFQFHDNDRVYLPQVLAPLVGLRAELGRHWNLGAELKWSAINHDLTYTNIDHPSVFGMNEGDLAPYIFVSYRME